MSTANVDEDGDLYYELDASGGGPALGGGGGGGIELLPEILHRLENLESRMAEVLENLFPNDSAAGTGDLVYVALTKTSGADGNKTATPSYTYSGTVAGTVYAGVTPAGRIWGAGRFVEASVGIGRVSGGSLTLLLALEQKRTKACS